ncbi:MAG: hypothetical protein HYZ43_03330 [Flavobacteriia bacterium]|nr:hypothetical protein [Flavobacteriia bacterium]
MDNHKHQSHFEHSFSIYYTRLKNAYRDGVKDSFNKEYAADYFRTILLDENKAIPAKTVFFDELRTQFDHLYGLFGNAAVSQVVEHLKPIREKSREALTQIERLHGGLGEPDFMELPALYDQQLEDGAMLTEIIEQEKQVLTLTDQQVVELLALYAGIQKLQRELRPDTALTDHEQKPDTSRKDRLTRSQQVLVYYFLLKASGVDYSGVSITDCARLLHKLIGVSAPDDIANSDLYKKLKKPMGEFDRKTIQDLRAIIPYFEKLPHYSAMKLINDHLRSCDGD